MDDKELSIRADLKNDFKHYAKKCLKIRTKNGAIVPLVLNKAQLYIHEKLEEQKSSTGKVRALILKGRQQGCSTLIGARFYHITTHNYGYQCFILTHSLDATNNLFRMAQRFHEHTPELVKPAVTTNKWL
jgi:phage terminase large subunit-like protein